MNRMSPEARELYLERRAAERVGKRAERRHTRRVQAFERSSADVAFRAAFGGAE